MHHTVGVYNSEWSNLRSLSRLRIYLILDVYTLPIALKKFLQVLMAPNELLTSAGAWRSISYPLVWQLLLKESITTCTDSCLVGITMPLLLTVTIQWCYTRTLLDLLVGDVILVWDFWCTSCTPDFALSYLIGYLGPIWLLVFTTYVILTTWGDLWCFILVHFVAHLTHNIAIVGIIGLIFGIGIFLVHVGTCFTQFVGI